MLQRAISGPFCTVALAQKTKAWNFWRPKEPTSWGVGVRILCLPTCARAVVYARASMDVWSTSCNKDGFPSFLLSNSSVYYVRKQVPKGKGSMDSGCGLIWLTEGKARIWGHGDRKKNMLLCYAGRNSDVHPKPMFFFFSSFIYASGQVRSCLLPNLKKMVNISSFLSCCPPPSTSCM